MKFMWSFTKMRAPSSDEGHALAKNPCGCHIHERINLLHHLRVVDVLTGLSNKSGEGQELVGAQGVGQVAQGRIDVRLQQGQV